MYAFISAGLHQKVMSPEWATALQTSALSLAVCVVCAVTTLFAISILYDHYRSKPGGETVHWLVLLVFVLPEAYVAVAFFFRGFVNLVHLTKLVKS